MHENGSGNPICFICTELLVPLVWAQLTFHCVPMTECPVISEETIQHVLCVCDTCVPTLSNW